MNSVMFPIKITFEDGSAELYAHINDVECNLEDFDSDSEKKCIVTDANGRQLRLIVRLLELKEISYI